MRRPHNRHHRLQGLLWTRFPAMATRGALGRKAKHSTRIGLRSLSPYFRRIGPLSLSPYFGAQSLAVFELAGFHHFLERIGTSPIHGLLPLRTLFSLWVDGLWPMKQSWLRRSRKFGTGRLWLRLSRWGPGLDGLRLRQGSWNTGLQFSLYTFPQLTLDEVE